MPLRSKEIVLQHFEFAVGVQRAAVGRQRHGAVSAFASFFSVARDPAPQPALPYIQHGKDAEDQQRAA
jgi:hypothetical protein